MTTFLRVLEETSDKETALLRAVREGEESSRGTRFEVDPREFELIPGAPFSYWISDAFRRLFVDLPLFESHGRTCQFGAVTTYDFRFLRLAWEISSNAMGS